MFWSPGKRFKQIELLKIGTKSILKNGTNKDLIKPKKF